MHFPSTEAISLIDLAHHEDVRSGDITTQLTFAGHSTHGKARIYAKAQGILAGLPIVPLIIERMAPNLEIQILGTEGQQLEIGTEVLYLIGDVQEILTAERTVLNFLQRMSGVATLSHQYAKAAYPAKVLDTRKTIPGWRSLDKYAVACGGGTNHRMGLHDMVLIKDNHIKAAGGVTTALERVFAQLPPGMKVEIEVEDTTQLALALEFPIDRIMLDNMSLEKMAECVALVRQSSRPNIEIEASGMTLERLGQVASTGVDFISVGALTHSVPAFDFSLRFL